MEVVLLFVDVLMLFVVDDLFVGWINDLIWFYLWEMSVMLLFECDEEIVFVVCLESGCVVCIDVLSCDLVVFVVVVVIVNDICVGKVVVLVYVMGFVGDVELVVSVLMMLFDDLSMILFVFDDDVGFVFDSFVWCDMVVEVFECVGVLVLVMQYVLYVDGFVFIVYWVLLCEVVVLIGCICFILCVIECIR